MQNPRGTAGAVPPGFVGPRPRVCVVVDETLCLPRMSLVGLEALDDIGVEMPAEIIVLQARPSPKAALQGDAGVTLDGSVQTLPTNQREGDTP